MAACCCRSVGAWAMASTVSGNFSGVGAVSIGAVSSSIGSTAGHGRVRAWAAAPAGAAAGSDM
jgi:hypothetical protein